MITDEDIEQFYHSYIQDLLAGADAESRYLEVEFSERIANELIEAGVLEGFEVCHYKAQRGMRVDGYWFNEDDASLDLFIVDFARYETLETLTLSELKPIVNRLKSFFVACVEKNLHENGLDETSEGYGLAKNIADRKHHFSKVNLYVFSERQLSERVKTIDEEQHGKWLFSTHVWDMTRLFRLYKSGSQKEDIVINFEEEGMNALPCLPTSTGTDVYSSYLIAISGDTLCALYARYGARLLEQNVRCFLQARGNVNKGIRATILNEPEMFFAYNNGITATAKDIVIEQRNGANYITKIADLQIVNGGQTTASLFHTQRKDKADLGRIFVQMKLSKINDDKRSQEIVPLISEYANTQNRVNAADFFSNHPFHLKIEECSRRMWAPRKEGEQFDTHWFYERARGQYADAQSALTPSEKKKFVSQNPKQQMFTKTDLAKFANVWDSSPHFVNLGAQKNFSKFAQRIGKEWEKNDKIFNDYYFTKLIAKAILFRKTEKIVSAQDWYQGGYRANIVAYTLGMLAEYCRIYSKAMPFKYIWNKQNISPTIERAIEVTAKIVHDDISMPPPLYINIGEWCKKEACWNRLKGKLEMLDRELSRGFKELLVDLEDEAQDIKDSKKVQEIDEGILDLTNLVKVPPKKWEAFKDACEQKRILTGRERGCLEVICSYPSKIPSDKQCKVINEVIKKAELEGVLLSL